MSNSTTEPGDVRLTDEEVEFIQQHVYEQLHLLPMTEAPASCWLLKNQLPYPELACFAVAMRAMGIPIRMSEMLDDPPRWVPNPNFEVPWDSVEEFRARQDSLRQWSKIHGKQGE